MKFGSAYATPGRRDRVVDSDRASREIVTTLAPTPPIVPSDLPTPGTARAVAFCAAVTPGLNFTIMVWLSYGAANALVARAIDAATAAVSSAAVRDRGMDFLPVSLEWTVRAQDPARRAGYGDSSVP